MSKQSIRANVAAKLLENVDRTSNKLVSEAARIVLQSTQASQCLILDRKAVRVLQTGFEAGIGRSLTAKEGTKYRGKVKKYFKQLSKPFPDIPGKRYFIQILRRNKLELGRNIFYTGVSFDTIKNRYHAFNKDFIKKTRSLNNTGYDTDTPGTVVHFDHGAEGTNVASLAGASQAIQIGVSRGFTPEDLFKVAGDNLSAIIDERFLDLSRGEKGKLKAELYDIIINWNQVVTLEGRLNAGVGIIVRPVSSGTNLQRAGLEKKEFNALMDAIDSAIVGVPWADIEGSSTLTEKVGKVVVTNLTKKLKKSKIKIDSKLSSAKLSTKTKTKDRTKGGSVSVSPAKKHGGAFASPSKRSGRRTKNTGFSQTKLYAALNAKINTVVAKNMKLPGLQYQTGRFASGVKITDVSKTPQGFPSIGYTYQLYPYQTFEPGFKQGSIDRDPRKLIDRSIREIAAQIVTGRLYTRRQ